MDRAPIAHVINDTARRRYTINTIALPSERSESSNRKINKWFLSARIRYYSLADHRERIDTVYVTPNAQRNIDRRIIIEAFSYK